MVRILALLLCFLAAPAVGKRAPKPPPKPCVGAADYCNRDHSSRVRVEFKLPHICTKLNPRGVYDHAWFERHRCSGEMSDFYGQQECAFEERI